MIPISSKVMELIAGEQWSDAEKLLLAADSAELMRAWQDAAYMKERARYLLQTRFEVFVP